MSIKEPEIEFRKSAYFESQWQFLISEKKICGFIGGVGSGKTHIFLRKTLAALIGLKNNKGKSNGWIIYPTNELAQELFVEPFKELLDKKGITYKYSNYRKKFFTKYGTIKIYQLQKPERMIGSNLTFIGYDEFDIENMRLCRLAFKKGLARLRGSKNAQMFIVSTPEGHKMIYEIFVKNKTKNTFMVRGRTKDNKYLPDDYIELLEEQYDSQMQKAYLEGEIVNLSQGLVYYNFKDSLVKPVEYDQHLPVCLGCDFNKANASWTLGQFKQKDVWFFDEVKGKTISDTPFLINELAKCLQKYDLKNNEIWVYGDRSGQSGNSRGGYTDYDLIENFLFDLKNRNVIAGYKMKYNNINPEIEQRVMVFNNFMEKEKVTFDPKCSQLIDDMKFVSRKTNGDIDKDNPMLTHASDGAGYFIYKEFPIVRPRRILEAKLL